MHTCPVGKYDEGLGDTTPSELVDESYTLENLTSSMFSGRFLTGQKILNNEG